MAFISFTNQVLDPNSVVPSYIPTNNYSLSGNGVDLISAGSNVECVVFQNPTIALRSLRATLSANATTGSQINAVTLRVNESYNGVQFAVVYKDRQSSLFTAATATQAPNGQTLSFNNSETVTPNLRRLVNLGYV